MELVNISVSSQLRYTTMGMIWKNTGGFVDVAMEMIWQNTGGFVDDAMEIWKNT